MKSEAPRYLAIEGAIGVGKTSLARRLADAFGTEPVLERPEENPFLERFYQARARFALPTQLFFLFQREFVLYPLAELDPDLVIPGHGGVTELLGACCGQRVQRLEPAASADNP